MKEINLTVGHRGRCAHGTSFTGRPEGKNVREMLYLSKSDGDSESYSIKMPEDTTSFNPSFYLGLLFDSIKALGWGEFKKKYQFDLTNMCPELQEEISQNLEDCERKAQNELLGLTGLD